VTKYELQTRFVLNVFYRVFIV